MARTRSIGVVATIIVALAPTVAVAQTTTYHLHSEASAVNPIYLQLKTAGPDPASVAYQSGDLKGMAPHSSAMRIFETQTGVPALAGVIPSGSTITFTLWMKKTAAFGTIYPQASMKLNDASGAFFCQATGTSALGTTLTAYEIACNTGSTINMVTTDRLWLAAGYSMTAGPGNKSVKVELDIEGTLNGQYDSRVVVPNPIPPSITGLNATSGPVNWSVTITGTRFGATQGPSTVTFNGAAAAPTSWGDTSITAPVPAGATTGPVVVTVNGAASNGVTFTVIPPPSLTSAAPTSAHRGESVTITGANFLASQGSSTITFNGVAGTPTSWSNTSIAVPVPSTATTGPIVVTVSAQASNSVPFTVIIPGTIGGTITRATGGSALAGATIQAVHTGIIKATATSTANGTYSIPNLDPGAYDVRVHATGYSSEVRSNTVVVPETTTTVDVAMSQPGSISGKVTQADGVTPLVGAAVTLFLGGIEKGSASTNATGDYAVAGLHVGAYTVQAAYVGYRTKEQGATILENTNTTSNLALSPMPAGPVTLGYDELGRLVMVVDAAGDAATYTYDAVGNILAIGRIVPGTVSIVEFTPNGAPVGATVTIFGTGFSETAGQNTVTFNGTAATVTSSTKTQIVVAVPGGATSGTIGVTTPTGSATSGSAFTVTAGTGAPSISGFTPAVAVAGSALTISGANFDPVLSNNRVTVNEMFATLSTVTAASIATTVPGAATSGKITVATPAGTAVSANDLFIAPPPSTAADVSFTARISYGEANALAVPISTAGKIALVLFDGVIGQRISLKVSAVTITGGAITVLGPQGAPLASFGFTTLGSFLDAQVLNASGTYTIVVDPNLSYTGSVTLTLYDVPPDVTGPIVPGGAAVPLTLGNPGPSPTPGQNARLTFAGAAGQKIAASVSAGPAGTVSILTSDGTVVGSISSGASAVFFDPVTLPSAGTYTVFVNPSGTNVGSITIALHDAADVTMSIAPDGPAITASVPSPGKRVVASFTAAAGQRVSLNLTSLSLSGGGGCQGSVSIVDPGAVVLRTNTCLLGDAFLDTTAALAAGVHTVVFDPATDRTGSAVLTLYDVPADVTGTLTINGPSASFSNTDPGQNGLYTFAGTQNQQVRVHVESNQFTVSPCVLVKLLRQDGQTQLLASTVCGTTLILGPATLPASESYTVKIDPGGALVRNPGLNVRVTSP